MERAIRARPVADAPVDELVERAEELARRWAVALVAARELSRMADVPLQLLASEAPALCAQLSRALGSDTELAQLLDSPDARADAGVERSPAPWAWIAADGDAAAAVRDVEALRGVVWAAAWGELRDPLPGQVAELADRLAFVCASLLAAVLARDTPASADVGATSTGGSRLGEQILYSSPPSGESGRRAVLIDELGDPSVGSVEAGAASPRFGAAQRQPPAGARGSGRRTTQRAHRSGPAPTTPRARPWDTPLDVAPSEERSLQDGSASVPWPERADPHGAPALRVTRGPGSPVDKRL
jgi:hypothetical protein